MPFAVRHPYPASERRRLRTATCVFFSITAGGNSDVLDVFGFSNTGRSSGGGGGNRDGGGGGVRGDGGGGNWGGVVQRGGSSSRHEQGRRRSKREGGGGVEVQGGRAADRPVSRTEEQLYAVLGALLEVGNWIWILRHPLLVWLTLFSSNLYLGRAFFFRRNDSLLPTVFLTDVFFFSPNRYYMAPTFFFKTGGGGARPFVDRQFRSVFGYEKTRVFLILLRRS